MNHHWHDNTCTRCGIKRRKKKARKVLYLYPMLTPVGDLYNKPAMKVVKLWNYGKVHRFERPDCPDDLVYKTA